MASCDLLKYHAMMIYDGAHYTCRQNNHTHKTIMHDKTTLRDGLEVECTCFLYREPEFGSCRSAAHICL